MIRLKPTCYFFILLFVFSSVLPAATYVVAPHGSDSARGTLESPWRSLAFAVGHLQAGDSLLIRQGEYFLKERLDGIPSGKEGNPVVISGFPGEKPVIDATNIPFPPRQRGVRPDVSRQGGIQLTGKSWIILKNICVQNSHQAGIALWESQHISILNVQVRNTFSSGISAWPGCSHIKILGCTIINANTHEMNPIPSQYPSTREAPHEAISMAGDDFEIAWNLLYDCVKEGIDVKETAKRGVVHHNYLHHIGRQGLYVDAWFGELSDIEFHHNVVHDCVTGIAISAEDGPAARNIQIHHNLFYNNAGCGIFFSRWGKDRLRTDVKIFNNTVHNNGHGNGDPDYWFRGGGCYLYSTQLRNVEIFNNIFSENYPYDIGVTDQWEGDSLKAQNVRIYQNLIHPQKNLPEYPVFLSWPDDHVCSCFGENSVVSDPMFFNPQQGNFMPKENSKAKIRKGVEWIGAFEPGKNIDFWWLNNFPPEF